MSPASASEPPRQAPRTSTWGGALVDAGFTTACCVLLGAAVCLVELGPGVMVYASPLLAAAQICTFVLARNAFFRGDFAWTPKLSIAARARGLASVSLIALGLVVTIAGRSTMPMCRRWPNHGADLAGIFAGVFAGLGVLVFSAAVRDDRRSPMRRLRLMAALVVTLGLSAKGFMVAGVLVSERGDSESLYVMNRTPVEIRWYAGDVPIEKVSSGHMVVIAPGESTEIHYGGTCHGYCEWFTTRRSRFERDFAGGISIVSASGQRAHLDLAELERRTLDDGAKQVYRLDVDACLLPE